MDTSLRVLLTEGESPPDRVDEMTRQLRRELLQLDVDDVVPSRGGKAPPGSRGWDMAQGGALLVTLGQSANALRTVVDAVRNWRARCRERPTIRLVIDGDVLEISEATPEQAARSFELFAGRHSSAGSTP
ncbi:effector-associated constant component EACC1 [Nocardiopsis sp. NPDC055824]